VARLLVADLSSAGGGEDELIEFLRLPEQASAACGERRRRGGAGVESVGSVCSKEKGRSTVSFGLRGSDPLPLLCVMGWISGPSGSFVWIGSMNRRFDRNHPHL